MYKVSVPIRMASQKDMKVLFSELEKVNAERVFLTLGILSFNERKRK